MATGQAILEKEYTALEALYSRIMPLAEAMGGRATRVASQIGIPSAMVATEQSEMFPALLLDMPDDYEVMFTPCNPMGIGYALLVRVRRMQGGVPKNSMTFHFRRDGWQGTKGPLLDDELREWLTPVRIRPAAY
ncbi:MAG: hypothetical protein WB679_04200 [Terracidiphilus sp.]